MRINELVKKELKGITGQLHKYVFFFVRVPYGKPDTPAEDKEYKLLSIDSDGWMSINSPVGNIKEWLKHLDNNYIKALFMDLDGSVVKKEVGSE